MNKLEATVALNLLPGIGPVRVQRLVEAFGSVEAVLRTPRHRIAALDGFSNEIAAAIADWENRVDLQGELRSARELGLTLITSQCERYPALLREIYDPPLVLYVRGELIPEDRQSVGVVGSRRATHYGLEAARKLSFQLAHAGVTVVSGLARGIDTAAHEGAIASGGRTIAVIGSGHGKLYPPENAALAGRIADGHGAVVSTFPVDRSPDKQTFPMRNRVISGWSFGTLVVEAPARSGALITVNQALEQGRNIYAVPGPIDRPTSLGTNRLIQQGATLVLDPCDILQDLPAYSAETVTGRDFPSSPALPALDPDENAIYKAIGREETQIESIIQRTGLPASTVSITLLKLEMKRLVAQLPGKNFVTLIASPKA